MKLLFRIFLFLPFTLHAGIIDSTTYAHIVQEGQSQFCHLLDVNDNAIKNHREGEMQFFIQLSGNDDPVDYVTGIQTPGHTMPTSASGITKDSINAKLRRVYRDYGVELYMIFIDGLDVEVQTPLPDDANTEQLFIQKLYDDRTNMAMLRDKHSQLTRDIISSMITDHHRDCIVLSKANYSGEFFRNDKKTTWDFSQVFTHRATPSTYSDITRLSNCFTSRLQNNSYFLGRDASSSAFAAVETFTEAAAYMKRGFDLLHCYTSDSIITILRQFSPQEDYEQLTSEQRVHILAVFSGYAMSGNWFNIDGEENYAVRVIATTPSKQLESLFAALSSVSPLNTNAGYHGDKNDDALIVRLINRTDDGSGDDDNNYTALMKTLTKLMTSDETVFTDHLPNNDAGWHYRQITWGGNNTPSVGSTKYSASLEDDGSVNVDRDLVCRMDTTGYHWTHIKHPIWTYDTTLVFQPFDLVFFKNQSSLSMLQEAGMEPNHVFVVPSVFLKYASDKNFNSVACQTVAVSMNLIALATGPGLIAGAIEAGDLAVAAFEAAQFTGAVGNLAANAINDPDLQSIVDKYNLIVGVWGLARLGTAVTKFSVNYFSAAKSGSLAPVSESMANEFRQSYTQAQSKLSELDDATRTKLQKMEEYLGEGAGVVADGHTLAMHPSWMPGRTITGNLQNPSALIGVFDKTIPGLGQISDTKTALQELNFPQATASDFSTLSEEGFKLLNTPNDFYHDADQFWNEYNKPWLDATTNAKADVYVLSDKENDLLKYQWKIENNQVKYLLDDNLQKIKTGFGKEIEYMDNLVNEGRYEWDGVNGVYKYKAN